MARIYKRHGSTVKSKVALEALKGNKTVAELCQEYGVASSQIPAWKKQLEESCEKIFENNQKNNHQEEIDRLHRVIGQITAERDFLERVLKR
jgi:transposase